MQWQSELHGEPSTLAVGAEQNRGHRYELSQQELKYAGLILVQTMACTVHTVLCGDIMILLFQLFVNCVKLNGT